MANQYLVDSPYSPFTIKNQFKAISNGKVYIGEVDKDPLNPSQQIQVYVVDETGSNVPVSQPIQLNAGGYLVYNGQVSKFITLEPYSMVVLNSVNAEMWRVDDISKVDPDNITASNVKDATNGGSVQDFIDSQSTTVAEIAIKNFPVGQLLVVTDRDNGVFKMQVGGTPNGTWILPSVGMTTAVLQDAGQNSLMNFGPIANQETFQAAVDFGNVTVKKGVTANIAGNIDIPANRRIITEAGSVVTSNGRFTAYGVNNVHWEIHGSVLSVGMTTAPAKSGWPNTAEGTQLGDERGLIEFGGIIFAGNDGDNYSVYVGKTGKVAGEWTGTPNFSEPERQVNRKGIAAWNCSNVSFVCDGEISGFEGEAIYWFSRSSASKNIYMKASNLHDCRFNGLNVNSLLAHENIKIESSTTKNCYHGIESSAGDVLVCTDYSSVKHAIYTGQGHGGDGRKITGNKSFNCLGTPFSILFKADYESLGRVKDVVITENHAFNPADGFLAVSDVENLQAHGNTCHHMQAGRFLQVTGCLGGSVSGNDSVAPAAGTEHIYRAENESVDFDDNKRITVGSNYIAQDTKSNGFSGGKYDSITTHGNRNNFKDMYCPKLTVGAGGEYRFSYGDGIQYVAATICSWLASADGSGANAELRFNNLKYNTGDTLATSIIITEQGHVLPNTNGLQNLGRASTPYNQLFAAVGTIQPSDSRLKTDPTQISDLVLDAWGDVNYVEFKYLSSVENKGEDARIHVGVIAQQIKSAFELKGLNALDYGLLCYDQWDYQPAILDEYDNILSQEIAAGDRWSIRPDECAFMEAAYMRRELKSLREKLTF